MQKRTKFSPNEIIDQGNHCELLTRGHNGDITGVVKFDKEDMPLIIQYKWRMGKGGYAVAHDKINNNKTVFMHRLVMFAPDGFEVDHINHHRYDNRKECLRIVTRAENQRNRLPKNRFRGVSLLKNTGMWMAYINKDGVRYYLGSFSSDWMAAIAYDAAAVDKFGDKALLNFE